MFERLQLKSSGTPEFRVELQHFDCERDLVDHALAGTVATRKEFEIAEIVMRSVTVAMMHSFVFVQRASEVFLHYVAMFKHLSSFFTIVGECGNRNIDVAVSLDVAAKVTRFKFCERFAALVCRFAFDVAKFLFEIYASARFTISVLFFSALNALKLVSFIGIFTSPNVRTSHRTVSRVSTKLLSVGSQVGLHHNERLAAFFAGKADWRSAGNGKFFFKSVRASARKAAIFATGLSIARIAIEWFVAIRTFHLDRHGCTPLLGSEGLYSCAARGCQVVSTEEI